MDESEDDDEVEDDYEYERLSQDCNFRHWRGWVSLADWLLPQGIIGYD